MSGANAMARLKEINAKIKSAASNMKSHLASEAKVRCSSPTVLYAQVYLRVCEECRSCRGCAWASKRSSVSPG
jgi:hypothetical protein